MSDSNRFSERVALVTGSSSGIGAAIADRLARAGASVILHGRSESSHLQATADAIVAHDVPCKIVTADLSDQNGLPEFVEMAWSQFGRIDILVNNAGGDVLTGAAADWSFLEKLNYLLAVDVTTTLVLAREIGGRMRAGSENSAIVNIGWDQARQGMAGDSGEMFATSKGAVMSMTLSLAQTLAPEVRVNCVAPGWIQTAWGRGADKQWSRRACEESLMNRWGTPADVANAVAYLVSEEASFVSGQILNVNGGFKFNQMKEAPE